MEKQERLNVYDEAFLNRIISNQPIIIFQFTVDKNNDLRFDYMNGQIQEFCETDFEEFSSTPWEVFKRIMHPDDKSRFISSVLQKMEHPGYWEIEFRVMLPVAGKRWYKITANSECQENGKTAFFGINSNITKQKKLEEEHRIAELRSQFANLASSIGVWDWNMVTNEVFYSAQSLKILEINEDDNDLISNPEKWDELVHPDDRAAYFGNIQEHFDGKIPYYETYHRVLCNGRYKWILDRGKVIQRDEEGKPLRIIGTHTDVTFQKDKEQKLQETFDMVNNQKGKLLNFAHIVSHNLKNHTGNFSTLLTFHKNGYLTTEEVITSLQTVSDDLSGTIENLVELVNVQVAVNEEKQYLNVAEYLSKVLLVLNEEIQKKEVKVVNDVPDALHVSFIPAYLESVILNLCTNAVKYSDPAKQEKKIEFYLEQTDEFLKYNVLCVKDNGLGIDLVKYKDSIFGLYKTFHKHKDSTGIGLYITKNQIEAMGGKIEVESEVGAGTIFKIYFKK
ncbi:PAS domain-containing protein [Flavobacterium sp. H122]|uniref:sensor histidine kinase n=1 Tax=Flavobacterium sp. H122 TaxID=2529860 RepID=UPI0010AAED66|nr:PAS domain-containing protein [Flavobacterium sp. H122]